MTFTFKVRRAAAELNYGSTMNWLHRYTKLVVASTVLLIAAGGMVTSTGSGLSVPDWPTTYGWSMFSFPIRQVGRRDHLRARPPADREHGRIPDDHPRRLDVARRSAALGPPARVRRARRRDPPGAPRRDYRAPVPAAGRFRSATPALAQLFFCITLSLALFTSRGWRDATPRLTTRCFGACRGDDDRARSTSRSCSARRCATRARAWRFRPSRWRSATSCRQCGRRRLRFTSPTAPARSSCIAAIVATAVHVGTGIARAAGTGPPGGAARAARC